MAEGKSKYLKSDVCPSFLLAQDWLPESTQDIWVPEAFNPNDLPHDSEAIIINYTNIIYIIYSGGVC